MIIYKCTNKINGKIYIGQTTNSLEDRRRGHIYSAMKRDKKTPFCQAIKKYGEDNFEWVIVDEAKTREELNLKESNYIKSYNSLTPNGYNVCPSGFGHPQTNETRKKIGLASLGRIPSEITRQRISISEKGKLVSSETRRKQAIKATGRKHSQKTIEKMSQTRKGKPLPTKAITARILKLTGVARTEEVKHKISETLKTKFIKHLKTPIGIIISDYNSGKSKNEIQKTYNIGRKLCNRLIKDFNNA